MKVIFIFFLVVSNYQRLLSNSVSDVCLTPACKEAADAFKSSLDKNVNPCDDFYQFACGGWMASHTIPEDKSSISIATGVEDELNFNLKALMEKSLNGDQPSFIKMAKLAYDSCINTDEIERAGAAPLKEVLRTFGGWPVVEGEQWDASKFDWVDKLISLRNLGFKINTLFSLVVMTDFKNNSMHTIMLHEPDFGMPNRDYFLKGLNDTSAAAYFQMMIKTAKLLGADWASVEEELRQAFDFEARLAKITPPQEEMRDFNKMYNKYTIRELHRLVPQIPWLKYFNGLLTDAVFENDNVIVFFPEFLKKVGHLIMNTEKRVIANYMIWRVVRQSLPILSKEWRDLLHDFQLATTGQKVEKERWEECISFLKENLGMAIGAYYVREYFQEDSKEAALEMVQYLQNEFKNMLENNDWMDEKTKETALEKASLTKAHIGYPEELLNDTAVEEFHENLRITNDDIYYNNYFKVQKWSVDEIFSHLRKPVIRDDWRTIASVAEVNAYNMFLENSIAFPAGILQGAYFNKDKPRYLNFGAIGYVIGHEITHGFDDTGKQFDKNGNNVNWWEEEANRRFTEKVQCIIDQYSNYTAENGMKLNGINTQGENVADNGGLKEAYLAYQSWVKDNGREPKLPGLHYTPNQLFFISSTYVWCAKHKPEHLKLLILTNVHAPERFRANGPLSNLPEFSMEFNCPPGSPMNRDHKCQVW